MRSNFLGRLLILIVMSCISVSASAQLTCNKLLMAEQAQSPQTILNLKNYVNNYSQFIPAVHDMIALGVERFGGQQAKGYCYRAVKGLLTDSGLVKKSIDGTFASSAHTKNFLVNRGFINLLERAPFNHEIKGALDENIPVGAILVFAGTNGVDGGVRPLGEGIGHIEIKCGERCFLFDTVNEFPGGKNQFTQANTFESGTGVEQRRLIGVYILDYFSLF